jgi:hypothetical protein
VRGGWKLDRGAIGKPRDERRKNGVRQLKNPSDGTGIKVVVWHAWRLVAFVSSPRCKSPMAGARRGRRASQLSFAGTVDGTAEWGGEGDRWCKAADITVPEFFFPPGNIAGSFFLVLSLSSLSRNSSGPRHYLCLSLFTAASLHSPIDSRYLPASFFIAFLFWLLPTTPSLFFYHYPRSSAINLALFLGPLAGAIKSLQRSSAWEIISRIFKAL